MRCGRGVDLAAVTVDCCSVRSWPSTAATPGLEDPLYLAVGGGEGHRRGAARRRRFEADLKKKTWGFPSQFIKSTEELMATPQGRRLGYHTPRSSSRGPGDDGAWYQFAAGPRQAMQERGTMLCVTTAVAVVEDYTVAHGRVEALGNAGGEHRVIDTAVLHVPGRRIMSSTMPVTGTGVGPQGDMRVAT